MDFGSSARDRIPATREAEQRQALLTLVSLDDTAIPMEGALSVHELIEMLGLDDGANEIRAQRGITPSQRTDPVSVGVRDSIGRLRHQPAPAIAVPDPVPSGRHGENGRCASGLHPWVEENIRPATESIPVKCRPCEQRRKRGGSTATTKDPDAPVLCRCPGKKHWLTAETSESTYVGPDGKRQCRVGIDRRKQAEAVPSDVPLPELKPGERFCGCKDERHVLTSFTSDTTYVNPSSGKRECRVGRRKTDDARTVAARKGRAA